MLGFDSAPIQAEKSLYDLASLARTQTELADYLARATTTEVVAAFESSSPPVADAESWRQFTRLFDEHLSRFGHASYDLDFAKGVPADDPVPLLKTFKYFLSGQGRSPHDRQAKSVSERQQATQLMLGRLKGLRLRWFRRLLEWSQRYAPLREEALEDIGLGWPQLRRMLREIGRRLAEAGAIGGPDDVFWLNADELDRAATALDANQHLHDYQGMASERRAMW